MPPWAFRAKFFPSQRDTTSLVLETRTSKIHMSNETTAGETPERRMLLRLYITRGAPDSLLALENLEAIRTQHLPDSTLEIVDAMAEPVRVLADGIMLTPTLVRLSPGPVRTILGNLADTERVVEAVREVGSR